MHAVRGPVPAHLDGCPSPVTILQKVAEGTEFLKKSCPSCTWSVSSLTTDLVPKQCVLALQEAAKAYLVETLRGHHSGCHFSHSCHASTGTDTAPAADTSLEPKYK